MLAHDTKEKTDLGRGAGGTTSCATGMCLPEYITFSPKASVSHNNSDAPTRADSGGGGMFSVGRAAA